MHAHDKTGLVRCVFSCLLMQLITPTDARLVWERATQGTHRPPSMTSFVRLFSCPIRMEYARNWRRRTWLRNFFFFVFEAVWRGLPLGHSEFDYKTPE